MRWAPEATPKRPEEVLGEPVYPQIVDAARTRGITRIVHFTHLNGLKGIIYTSAVKSRRDLPEDEQVKYVYEPNAVLRGRDREWHGYVNLSVTTINAWMFKSSKEWHPQAKWALLGFGPEVLGDPGVVFCTTNNAYPVVHRATGLEGFQQMFAPRVPGRYGSIANRLGRTRNQTTDPQAEVLYPGELALDHLQTITLPDEETYESAIGILTLRDQQPEVLQDAEAFQ